MAEVVRYGETPFLDRRHTVIFVNNLDELPQEATVGMSTFVLFLVIDGSNIAVEKFANFVELMIKTGMVYFSVWGPDCNLLEDIADETASYPAEHKKFDKGVLMTTSHADESLKEAVDFFLHLTQPSENFQSSCKDGISIIVNNKEWANEVNSEISNQLG